MLDITKDAEASARRALRVAGTIILALVLCGFTLYLGEARIKSHSFKHDFRQNFTIAYNLVRSGQYSMEEPSFESTLKPTMRREPFPIFVTAAWLWLAFEDLAELKFISQKDEKGQHALNIERANGKNAAKHVNKVNLLWSVLAVFLSFLAARVLTGSLIVALIAGLAVMLAYATHAGRLSLLLTELAASVPILATSLCLALLMRVNWFVWSILAGLFLGLAALTKAIILYAVPAIAITIALLLFAKTGSWRAALRQTIILLAVTGLVVGPWIARNTYLFGASQVAGGGTDVLEIRLLLDRMTPEEYRASFYAWAPADVRPALEWMFGFSRADITQGGVGERLIRHSKADLTVEAHEKLSSRRERLKAEGHNDYLALADQEVRDEAIASMTQSRHILVSIPLAWRVMWVRLFPTWLAPPAVGALLVAFFWGAWSRRYELVAFATTSILTLGIYTFTTHNRARYSEPFVPVMLVCLVVLLYLLLTYLIPATQRWLKGGATKTKADT